MRLFVLSIVIIAALWDISTVLYGTISVLGEGPAQIFAATLFSLFVFGFLVSTRKIIRLRTGGGLISGLLFFFWFISLFYNFYTSWIGNANLLAGEERRVSEILILIGLTLLGTSAPILLSALWRWAFGINEGENLSTPTQQAQQHVSSRQ